MDMQQMGIFIRTRREALGMTQKELSERIHVTNSAVSKWERNLSLPDTAILSALANALGVSEGELLTGKEKKTLRFWWRRIWRVTLPKKLLPLAIVVFLAGMLLSEAAALLTIERYHSWEGAVPGTRWPYDAAIRAGHIIAAAVTGLSLARTAHRRSPFPVSDENPLRIWIRDCLPGLAAAFVLWFVVCVLLGWGITDPGYRLLKVCGRIAVWESTGPNSYTISLTWPNLPYFFLGNLVTGLYSFWALAAYFFYGLGACWYRKDRV